MWWSCDLWISSFGGLISGKSPLHQRHYTADIIAPFLLTMILDVTRTRWCRVGRLPFQEMEVPPLQVEKWGDSQNAIWIPQWPWSFVTLLATLLLWRPWWWRWSWGDCKMQQVSKCSGGFSKHVRTSLWMWLTYFSMWCFQFFLVWHLYYLSAFENCKICRY